MGKPYKQSLKELKSMLSIANSLIALAPPELESDTIEVSETKKKIIKKEPVGVVFLLCPYNEPLISVIGSLVPAVLSGNPVLIKHSPYTPLTSLRFSKAFEEAGVPFLVQDLFLETKKISEFLNRKEIGYVHLVGQSDSGRALYQEIASKSFIDIGLFLSSNNGVYVAEDVDLQTCVSSIIKSSMEISGQTSHKFAKVFVHNSLFTEFLDKADPIIRSFSMGDPMDDMTTIGPITEPDNIDELNTCIQEVINTEGQIICGGYSTNDDTGKGRFFEPTILTGIDDSLRIAVLTI